MLILLGLKETDRTAVASMRGRRVPFMVAAFLFLMIVFGRAIVLSIRRRYGIL